MRAHFRAVADVALSQGGTDSIELANIFQRQVRPPAPVDVDQLDFDLCDVIALMQQFGVFASRHSVLRRLPGTAHSTRGTFAAGGTRPTELESRDWSRHEDSR